MSDTLRIDINPTGIATVTLDRPERCNAIDEVMVAELTATLAALAQNPNLRVLVLAANGGSFCSGADYHWMQRALEGDQHQNFEEALRLGRLLQLLDRFPVPTIARVNGSTVGTGVGLVACCDMVVAHSSAWFRLPEVELGLVPAVIAPFVMAKIGGSAARRYLLTAEELAAPAARELGLVHEIADSTEGLDIAVERWCNALLRNGQHAVTSTKKLIAAIGHRLIDDALISDTAHRTAHLRAHPEARQGVVQYLKHTTLRHQYQHGNDDD
ncbi:methylglutaconyl-CoA hydratase [Andreprevotia lacus DSM 23236]|jgi:methylglutaconyl-CoA hydratase|uniref:Methylglutaconyl-CoA hydratase n=1 Tax=Andreprevotia lacus DSM 23236 TaxID=1121001 RepID=A0A1W1XEC1_9NEIS|nr:enoyl-CoA hydratase-related protein [Andreprevotia lacus]SMC22220.1 methylglutaconyl-CoA hydratase [Andreprevotia lacus DSM 23236]